MSYIALYRKLRPKTFEDVLGQTPIITTLKNQIVNERVSHAYLFAGTRGTGKTSTAKLFAKAINCISSSHGEPCNECEFCQEANNGTGLNIIEIDAASNNGVDNIRELREEVKYSPAKGKYKVYIIDEVHMLSSGAFNALLKTLEEPPKHVVFILATTDPQKIPATILSRCQRFDFKRITVGDMSERLDEYMRAEGISIEKDALHYIARISDGAMRDSLSILDQVITMFYEQNITLENVLEALGSVDNQFFFDLTDALIKFDSKTCIEIIDILVANGRDISQFVADYLSHLRNLLISAHVKADSKALDFSAEDIAKLNKQVQCLDQDILIHYINAFAELQGEIKYSSNERIFLEITCIRLCNPETTDSKETLSARIQKLENKWENGVTFDTNKINSEEVKPTIKKKVEKAIPNDIQNLVKSWKFFVDTFEMPVKGYLANSAPKFLEGNSLVIMSSEKSVSNLLELKEQQLKDKLEKMFKKDFNISFLSKDQYNERHNRIYGDIDKETEENKCFTDFFGDDIIIDNKKL